MAVTQRDDGSPVQDHGSAPQSHPDRPGDFALDPSSDREGRLASFANVARDPDAHQVAREPLKRYEEQFKLLVQSVADYAIYMLDLEGNITSWNLGAQRLKGYGPEEIMGQHFSRFLIEEDREAGEDRRALATALREGTYEKQAWRLRKDGSRFWANVVIEPILEADRTVVGFAKITRDTTERRDVLLALEKTREALFRSQKLEALGKLTGGVAHDFNNLLGAVLGSLEVARKYGGDRPRLLGLIDNAIEAAQRGATLTKRMLAFARHQDLRSEPTNVIKLVAGMAHLLRQSLGLAIVVTTRFPPAIALVHADVNQLELALLNLAVNARDAMPGGGEIIIVASEVDVALERGVRLAPARYVCLSVIDTGTGMDEVTLARSMEPFFTTKEVGKGTGLGLSMVHGMLEQLGGQLILRSREGAGTTAEIWLPVVAADADHHDGTRTAPRLVPVRARPLRVLAVDDDIIILKSTTAMLEDLGHTVVGSLSGPQALDILRDDAAIDLVITDHGMPRMTGFELILILQEEFSNVPIVLASGYAELPHAIAASVPKLSKPYGQQALSSAITQALRTSAPS